MHGGDKAMTPEEAVAQGMLRAFEARSLYPQYVLAALDEAGLVIVPKNAIREENEACARIAEDMWSGTVRNHTAEGIAAAIRARMETK